MFNPILHYQNTSRIPLIRNGITYYKLDTNANDSIGTNNGALINSPTFIPGKISNAIDFDNTIAVRYVDIPDSNDFSFTNGTNDIPFSVSLWVYFYSFSPTGNWLISKRRQPAEAGTINNEWQIVYSTPSNQLVFQKFSQGDGNVVQSIASPISPFLLNTWYHITCTDNGTGLLTGMKMYINGLLQTTIASDNGYVRMNNTSSKTYLGHATFNLGANYKHRGMLDEIYVLKNRVLRPSEVKQLYNNGNGLNYPF